jgi:hypothetical protein
MKSALAELAKRDDDASNEALPQTNEPKPSPKKAWPAAVSFRGEVRKQN